MALKADIERKREDYKEYQKLMQERDSLKEAQEKLMEENQRIKDEFESKITDLHKKQDEFDKHQAEFRANEMNFHKETEDAKALLKNQEDKIKKESEATLRKEDKLKKLKAEVESRIEDFHRKRDQDIAIKESNSRSSKANHKTKHNENYLPPQVFAELTGKKLGYCWRFWDGVKCRCNQEKPDSLKHACYNCDRYHPTSRCPDGKPQADGGADKPNRQSEFCIDDEPTACNLDNHRMECELFSKLDSSFSDEAQNDLSSMKVNNDLCENL